MSALVALVLLVMSPSWLIWPERRPTIRTTNAWSSDCVGDLQVGRCVFATTCYEGGPYVVIDGEYLPAPTLRKWEPAPGAFEGCR